MLTQNYLNAVVRSLISSSVYVYTERGVNGCIVTCADNSSLYNVSCVWGSWTCSSEYIIGLFSSSKTYRSNSWGIVPGISLSEPAKDEYAPPSDEYKGSVANLGLTWLSSTQKVSQLHDNTCASVWQSLFVNNTDSAITVNCQYTLGQLYNGGNNAAVLLDHTKFDKPKIVQPSGYLNLTTTFSLSQL